MIIYAQTQMLTAVGGVDGTLAIRDATNLAPGAQGVLSDANSGPFSVVVETVDYNSNTILVSRNGVYQDLSSFSPLSGASVYFPRQSSPDAYIPLPVAGLNPFNFYVNGTLVGSLTGAANGLFTFTNDVYTDTYKHWHEGNLPFEVSPTSITYRYTNGTTTLTATDGNDLQGIEIQSDGTYFAGFYVNRVGYGSIKMQVSSIPTLSLFDGVGGASLFMSSGVAELSSYGGARLGDTTGSSHLDVLGPALTFFDGSTIHDLLASGIGGADTQVQFNDSGVFGGSVDLTFNKGTGALTSTSLTTTAASGTDAIVLASGARIWFGQTTTDYWYGNGGAIRTNGGIQVDGNIYTNTGVVGNAGSLILRSLGAAGAAYRGLKIYQNTDQTVAGAYLMSVYRDQGTTLLSYINQTGLGFFAGGISLGAANAGTVYNDASYAIRSTTARFDTSVTTGGLNTIGISSTNIGGSGIGYMGGAIDTSLPAISHKFYNYGRLTKQQDRIFTWYNDNNANERLYINPAGYIVAPEGTTTRTDGASAGVTRTNLCLESQTFNAATWVKSFSGAAQPTVAANSTAAPDGGSTADTITFGAVAANQYAAVGQGISLSASTQYVFSVWLKAAVPGPIYIYAYGAGSFLGTFQVDATTNWRRYHTSFTTVGAGTYTVYIGCDTNTAGTTMTAKSAITLDAWGAQVETGIRPTPYILTTGTSANAVHHNAHTITTLTQMTAGRLLSVQNADVEKFGVDTNGAIYTNGISNSAGYIASNAGFLAGFGNSMALQGRVADGATAVNAIIDTFGNDYVTAGAKLLSVRNNAVEKFSVDYAGSGVFQANLTAVASMYATTFYARAAGSGAAMYGQASDGAAAIGIKFGNTASLTTAGSKIAVFYSDGGTTEKASIDRLGGFQCSSGITASTSLIAGVGGNNTTYGQGAITVQGSGGTLSIRSAIATSGTATAIRFGNVSALTTAGDKIASFFSDAFTTEKAYIDKDGLFFSATNPLGRKVAVPSTATSTGVVGDFAADASWFYVCTATDTWRRVAVASW